MNTLQYMLRITNYSNIRDTYLISPDCSTGVVQVEVLLIRFKPGWLHIDVHILARLPNHGEIVYGGFSAHVALLTMAKSR